MERLIPDTMAHLQQFALQQIMPAHCTGWRALWALLNTFGESVVTPSAVGSRFTFDTTAIGRALAAKVDSPRQTGGSSAQH